MNQIEFPKMFSIFREILVETGNTSNFIIAYYKL